MKSDVLDNNRESEVLLDIAGLVRLLFSAIISHKIFILGVTLCAIVLALLHISTSSRSYSATTRILVENRVISSAHAGKVIVQSKNSEMFVINQIEILRSEKIARQVILDLKLLDEPVLGKKEQGDSADRQTTPDTGPAVIQNTPAAGTSNPNSARMNRALKAFKRSLIIRRAPLSSLIDITYMSSIPQQSAKIANSLVTAYLRYHQAQKKGNTDIARSTSGWLRERLQTVGVKARVLGRAITPTRPDGLSALIKLILATFGGFSLALGIAFIREMLDATLKTPGTIAAATQKPCFGYLLTNINLWYQFDFVNRLKSFNRKGHERVPNALLDWSIERPRSTTTHTLRRAAIALMTGASGSKVLGVVSARPDEGKTVTAVNFARILTQFNKKVLLIDADCYNPSSTNLLLKNKKTDRGNDFSALPLDQLIVPDDLTDMHFLPSFNRDNDANPDTHHSSFEDLENILKQARKTYDVIILDLPPFVPVADALQLETMLDKFLLVIESAKHTAESLHKTLAVYETIHQKVLGSVIANANSATLKRYTNDFEGEFVSDCPNYVDNHSRTRKKRRSFAGMEKEKESQVAIDP